MKIKNIIILLFVITAIILILGNLPTKAISNTNEKTNTINKITTDEPTPNLKTENMQLGEVFVDKSVYTGDITIDQHKFSSNEFLVQLTAIAKKVKESTEPIDIVLMLDTTYSTGNPIVGSNGPNGSIDDFIITLNNFIDIVMKSNEKNRIGVICYGGRNVFIKDTNIRLGSKPIETLLELGHYKNENWNKSKPYEVTFGQGIGTSNYLGGEIIIGKYISFYESSINNSVFDYITDPNIRNNTWATSTTSYTFRIESAENIKRDNQTYTKHTNYGGLAGTGTQNAYLTAYKYLKENIKGSTAIVCILTDGDANIAHYDYMNITDYSNPIDNQYNWVLYNNTTYNVSYYAFQNDANYNFDQSIYITDWEDKKTVGTLTIATATGVKEDLKKYYNNVYIYTISMLSNTEYTRGVLNPETLLSSTEQVNKDIYNDLTAIFKQGRTITLSSGKVVKNLTGTSNYNYSDGFYYAEDQEGLHNALNNILQYSCEDITFTDTIGDYLQVKNIKGIIKDGKLYNNFSQCIEGQKTTYTINDFPEVYIQTYIEGETQKLKFFIPQSYSNNNMKLIFEVGLQSNIDFANSQTRNKMQQKGIYNPTNKLFKFYSNESAEVEFIKTKNNPYNSFVKTVRKSNDKTGRSNYISSGSVQDNKVTIMLGNNGILETERILDFSGSKEWKDDNNSQKTRPDKYTLKLYADGNYITQDNFTNLNWSFHNLPKYKDDTQSEIVYTIQEDEISLSNGDKYIPKIDNNKITNVLTGTTNIETRKVWEDEDNKYNTRPQNVNIVIKQLLSNDIIKETTINSQKNWRDVSILPKYNEEGKLIQYAVDEKQIPKGYTKEINNFTVKNTLKKYNYKIEYYFNGIKDESKTEKFQAPYNKEIRTYNEKIDSNSIYQLDKVENLGLKISENEENNIIKVYYAKKDTNVVIKYIDKTTNQEIANKEIIKAKIGDNYTSTAKQISNYTLIEDTGNTKGVTTEQEIVVIYYYLYNSKIKVQHIDKSTNKLLEEQQKTGLEGQKIKTLSIDIPNYMLVEKPQTEEYTFDKKIPTIKYYYSHIAKGIIEKHIDIKSNELLEEEIIHNGNEGDEYFIKPKQFANYDLVKEQLPTNNKGKMTIELIEVKYYYIAKSSVIVQYVDSYSNKTIEREDIKGHEGDKYKVEPKEIKNYKLDESRIPQNSTGEMQKDTITVKYYVISKSQGVETNYIDKTTGKKIATSQNIEGYENEIYETLAKDIEGYSLVGNSGNTKGKKAKEKINVEYYYLKDCKVIVNYIDKITKQNIKQEEILGLENKEYKVTSKQFEKYDLVEKELPNNSIGTFISEEQVVNYYYIYKSKITVNYIDKDNDKLLETTVLEGHEGDNLKTKEQEQKYYKLIEKPETEEYILTKDDMIVNYYYRKLKFNIKVEQIIDKIILNNKTTNINSKMTKIELPIKQKQNNLKICYTIKVTNDKELEGNTQIVNYIPEGFMVLPKENVDWNIKENKAYIDIENLQIGETREYTIILTNNTQNITGTITNRVVAESSSNIVGFNEITLEDNRADTELIVGIVTGIIRYLPQITFVFIFILILIAVNIYYKDKSIKFK